MNFPTENEDRCISQTTQILAVSKKLMVWFLRVLHILFNLGQLSP